jgi:hypothetical protein
MMAEGEPKYSRVVSKISCRKIKVPSDKRIGRKAITRGISRSGKDKSGAFVQIWTVFKDDNKTNLVVV